MESEIATPDVADTIDQPVPGWRTQRRSVRPPTATFLSFYLAIIGWWGAAGLAMIVLVPNAMPQETSSDLVALQVANVGITLLTAHWIYKGKSAGRTLFLVGQPLLSLAFLIEAETIVAVLADAGFVILGASLLMTKEAMDHFHQDLDLNGRFLGFKLPLPETNATFWAVICAAIFVIRLGLDGLEERTISGLILFVASITLIGYRRKEHWMLGILFLGLLVGTSPYLAEFLWGFLQGFTEGLIE